MLRRHLFLTVRQILADLALTLPDSGDCSCRCEGWSDVRSWQRPPTYRSSFVSELRTELAEGEPGACLGRCLIKRLFGRRRQHRRQRRSTVTEPNGRPTSRSSPRVQASPCDRCSRYGCHDGCPPQTRAREGCLRHGKRLAAAKEHHNADGSNLRSRLILRSLRVGNVSISGTTRQTHYLRTSAWRIWLTSFPVRPLAWTLIE